MILSMCLCQSVVQEDYTKVPKYWSEVGASFTRRCMDSLPLTLSLSLSLSHFLMNTHTHTLRQLSPPLEPPLPSQLFKFLTPHMSHKHTRTQTPTFQSIFDTLVGQKSTSYHCCLIILCFLRRRFSGGSLRIVHVWYYAEIHLCVVFVFLRWPQWRA